jgi:hypothetical protein
LHYEDYIFFRLNDKSLVPISHEDFVELVHGRKPMPEHADQHIRLAIFYVEMLDCRPKEIVNATYGLLKFDTSGFVDPAPQKHSLEDNREFFKTIAESGYDNIDCDPEIQQLREELEDEFSWVPTDSELGIMVDSILSSSVDPVVAQKSKPEGGGSSG